MINKIIVGLGNPGKKYKDTKHNMGFIFLDSYAKANRLKFKKSLKFNSEILEVNDTILLKPKTFMNRSGYAVQKVISYYNIPIENILVIYDDVDLPFGSIRLRLQGGSGGHNGIKSIIQSLSTDQFKRLRIGIDKNNKTDIKEYVLDKLSKSETKQLKDIEINIITIIQNYINNTKFDYIMNEYNKKQ